MRSAFIKTLVDLAEKDKRIILLTADLGYTVLEPFAEKFPDRFFNVGVAEQNMVGMATALAKEGLIPFCYSISNFACLRPYEFIRNGPIHHQLPVRIVGVGGGFDYGPAGVTHFGLEDIGLMRLHKEMMVVVPADVAQSENALKETWDHCGPIYYRIGKGDKSLVPNLNGYFQKGKLIKLKEGKDILLFSYGSLIKEALKAADILAKDNVHAGVVLISNFNPSADQELSAMLSQYRFVLTVEDHYITSGLGSYVAEIIAERAIHTQLIRCGIKETLQSKVGSREFLYDLYGISANKLVETIRPILEKKRDVKPTVLNHSSHL